MEAFPPKQRISITTGTIIRFFLVVLFVAAVYYLFDVVVVVLAAIVIASAIEPVVRRLKHYKIPRVAGVLIIYFFLIAAAAALIVFFLPVVVGDTVQFLQNIPKTISLESVWSPIRDIGTTLGSTSIGARTISVTDFITGLQSMVAGDGAGAFQTASVLFGGVLSIVLSIVLSFYLAVQESGVEDFLRIVTPVKSHDYIVGLWKRSQRKIGFWLQGQIVLGLIMGVLVYATLAIVGIPHALLLAIFAALLEIIPVFGPIIAAVPAVALAFSERGVGTAALLVGLYLVLHQLENQVFYPLVVKKIVGISPIVVILALVIGAKLAGVLGALIAVPLSAALMEYVDDVERGKRAQRGLV
ncbi:MAG: AI-2E family transporter [Patescibacteria group bacterium]